MGCAGCEATHAIPSEGDLSLEQYSKRAYLYRSKIQNQRKTDSKKRGGDERKRRSDAPANVQ
jgi:hypothetical protein